MITKKNIEIHSATPIFSNLKQVSRIFGSSLHALQNFPFMGSKKWILVRDFGAASAIFAVCRNNTKVIMQALIYDVCFINKMVDVM